MPTPALPAPPRPPPAPPWALALAHWVAPHPATAAVRPERGPTNHRISRRILVGAHSEISHQASKPPLPQLAEPQRPKLRPRPPAVDDQTRWLPRVSALSPFACTSSRSRPSIPSATTDIRTGPTASTTAPPTSRAASATTSSDETTALQAARPTLRPCKTKGEAASRVKAFENDPRWLAKCTAARERREQLDARHAQDAKTRWQSAVRGPDQSMKRIKTNHPRCTRTSTSASTTTSANSSTDGSTSTSSSGSSNTNSSHSPKSSSGTYSSDTPASVGGPSVQASTTVGVPSNVRDHSTNAKWLAQRVEGRELPPC